VKKEKEEFKWHLFLDEIEPLHCKRIFSIVWVCSYTWYFKCLLCSWRYTVIFNSSDRIRAESRTHWILMFCANHWTTRVTEPHFTSQLYHSVIVPFCVLSSFGFLLHINSFYNFTSHKFDIRFMEVMVNLRMVT